MERSSRAPPSFSVPLASDVRSVLQSCILCFCNHRCTLLPFLCTFLHCSVARKAMVGRTGGSLQHGMAGRHLNLHCALDAESSAANQAKGAAKPATNHTLVLLRAAPPHIWVL